MSYEQALKYAEELMSKGIEGAILKDLEMPYEPGKTSQRQIKLKAEKDADLEVIELVQGSRSGKFAELFGSIRCGTKDRKLIVDVSGITDAERLEISNDPSSLIDKTVTVVFNSVTKNGDTYSLFLPRFSKVQGRIEVRDKEPDTLKRVLEIGSTIVSSV